MNTELKTLAYERINADRLRDAMLLRDGEHLLVRQPFRWLLDGSPVQNGYEMFAMETIVEEHRLHVVETYGDSIAIVTKR